MRASEVFLAHDYTVCSYQTIAVLKDTPTGMKLLFHLPLEEKLISVVLTSLLTSYYYPGLAPREPSNVRHPATTLVHLWGYASVQELLHENTSRE